MTQIKGKWLEREGTRALMQLLAENGYQVWFVGGCVRNALLGQKVSDIDIATDARPETVIELSGAGGLKPVPTGVEHGTVTVVAGGIAHEVTTFRRDVDTDGRRAVVDFSRDISDDARRRDFTMNALYAGADGVVLDPLGTGLADLAARQIRFIEDAETRIREDYLRILRFFRFYAIYGKPDAGPDPEGLDACARLSDGLETLSAERIGAETLKLLSAANPAPAIAAMDHAGVLARILPGSDARALAPVVHLEDLAGLAPDPLRRLVALGGEDVEKRLRLSRAQARRLELLRRHVASTTGPHELGYRLGHGDGADVLLLRAAVFQQPLNPSDLEACAVGARAEFPVKPADLMPDLEGAALGARLAVLETRWITSGFTLSKDALLS